MRLEVIVAAHARRTPDRVAVTCGGRRQTYRELVDASDRLACGLSALGVGVGDRVLIYVRNSVEFVQCLCASFRVGAVVVPVNTRLTPKEIRYFVSDSKPHAIVYDAASRDVVESFGDDLGKAKRLVIGEAGEGEIGYDDLLRTPISHLAPLPCDATEAMIIYTSGTTGRPKGALITHANVLVQHGFINAIEWTIGRDDVYLVTTPLAHRTAQGRLGNSLCLGGTLVIMEKFDAEAAVELIESEGVTVAGMVPTVARMLIPVIEKSPSRCRSLRRIVVTGEAFPVEVKKRLMELLPHVRLASFFAMTEVGAVTSLDHEEQFTHAASVGRVTPGVEVRLVDDGGSDVPVGETGEMLVRTGRPGAFTTFLGYFNRQEDTAATIDDGWVRTGDLARFDDDGYMYIVDRKKDMVLSGGFNIYTKEVEQALHSHPSVRDAAVVGVPDAVFGEAVAAFVELEPGITTTAEELIEHCRESIASYKKPKYVFFVDVLPRNTLGKVLKADLRSSAAEMVARYGAK